MTKYSLSLVASLMVISVAFMQCSAPENDEAQVTSQLDTSMSVITAEVKVDSGLIAVDQPEMMVDKPKEMASKPKVARIDKPAMTTNKPKAIITEKPSVAVTVPKITTTEKPIPTIVEQLEDVTTQELEAAAPEILKAVTTEIQSKLTAADFSLKSVNATISGTSTLHDWVSKVTVMEGKGSFQMEDNVLSSIKDAEIKIKVTGIKSEEGDKMDDKTYEAFNSDKYPSIIFPFSNAVVNINDTHAVSIGTTGNLTMAGTSKAVSLLAIGKELPNGDLQLTVSKTIKMTDFNMEPPVMFLGAIKVGDEITVSFDFVLSKD
ncbi:YceI family protein [Lewinella sp. LCG006]|uniref:YceI family protein n=1 Tax=Lewinella sp. LCG006 TaxID=3231911 RepID=UPI00345F1DB9